MNGESDEANNVNVLQKKIQKVVEEQEKMKEEFTSAMKKTRDDVSLLADKLDQLIEKVNLLPDKHDVNLKSCALRGKEPRAGKETHAAATQGAAAIFTADNSSNDSNTGSLAGSQNQKKKKKKKRNMKESDSSSEGDEYDPYKTTGNIYDVDSEEEEGKEGYPRRRCRQPFSINIDEFEFGKEDANWSSWVKKFETMVKVACNPRNLEEHHKFNLRWRPTKLNLDAHDIFLLCRHKNNWTKVVKELEEAFDNPECSPPCMWDEICPLHVFKANVISFVHKIDSEIRDCPRALKKAYYSRFVGGMPEDYVDFIETTLYDSKRTIDRALKVSQQFQIMKKRNAVSDRRRNKHAFNMPTPSGNW